MQHTKEWFSEWFDSPYYHVLYHNRDDREAQFFLDNLVNKLHITPGLKVADLACGKGRHAIYLNKLGFDVTGFDLSAASIAQAKLHANSRLHFEVQDLRTLDHPHKFDIALNLFTSFGYFQSEEEDLKVLRNIYNILKPDGYLLIDFFNIHTTLASLVEAESKRIGEIMFHIRRWNDDKFLYKKISLKDGDMQFEFIEQVQLINDEQFEKMLNDSGFGIVEKMGNYQLQPYQKGKSDRLIILAQKR
jgi:SAM-dependent methyltransferase